jgi:hypothetical protein|nr:MAG TPA: Single-stranded DNA-binding protein strand DNA-binding domain, SSB.2A [Caudoviricetes sp.]
MAYNNGNGRGGYNGGNRGGYNNNRGGGNRGNYNNGGGQYRQNGGGGGGYQNRGNNGGYQNNGGGQQNEKRFGAGFRIRGIVCQNKDGDAVQVIPTRNGGIFVTISVMVSKFSNSGRRDDAGKTIWNEDKEYFRMVAFGQTAEQLANDIVLHANVEFTGTIGYGKEYNGRREIQFVVSNYAIKSLPNNNGGGNGGNRGGQQNGGYQQRNNGGGYQQRNNGGGYNDGGYDDGGGYDGGNQGGVSYDERPNNGGQSYRQTPQPQPHPQHDPEPEGDFPEGGGGSDGGEEDIPF